MRRVELDIGQESVPVYPRSRLEPTGKLGVAKFDGASIHTHTARTILLAPGFPNFKLA